MGGKMNKESLVAGLISVAVVSLVAVGSLSVAISYKRLIGPTLILLGFLSLVPLRLFGRSIKSCSADIVFGAIDTGFLGVAALIGASFAGVLGAIVGGAAGDAITDGFAGLWEGKVAQHLRKRGIREARTPLSASMGKMAGCFLGVGLLLTFVWTIAGT
jgi:sugar phosphate permease